MKIMTRMGKKVLDLLGSGGEFILVFIVWGGSFSSGAADVAWPCNPEKTHVVHFPEPIAFGLLGAATVEMLLGKKSFASVLLP